ncbi:uncharacterized protein ACR2FA_011997 [Aphomia sociella]
MDSLDEIKLISHIEQYPCLYDIFSPLYGDYQQKINAWDEIGKSMSSRPRECKLKWTRLRENFRKALKMRESAKKGTTTMRPVKYEKQLSFLKPFLNTRAVSNTPQSDDSCSSMSEEDSDNHNESRKRKNGVSLQNSVGDVDQRAQNNNHIDPIDSFFTALAATVKTFPKELQIRVKRQVFDVVSDAELSLLTPISNNKSDQHLQLCNSNNSMQTNSQIKIEEHDNLSLP